MQAFSHEHFVQKHGMKLTTTAVVCPFTFTIYQYYAYLPFYLRVGKDRYIQKDDDVISLT